MFNDLKTNMRLFCFDELFEGTFVCPINHILLVLLFLIKHDLISICKMKESTFNINVIKHVNNFQNTEMIFLNGLLKRWHQLY